MKTILLVNDDGVHSIGLTVLKRSMAKLGKVVVVTPKDEVSGVGKAITSTRHVRVDEIRLDSQGPKIYAIDGTPADAYLLAANKILKKQPDLVVTGINLGPNLGIDDFLNSGTIGAALEAAIHGVPAIAVSYCKKEMKDQKADKSKITADELQLSGDITETVARSILEEGMPPNVDLISVNVPENADCSELRVTELSYIGYGDLFTREESGYRIARWRLSDYADPGSETDVHVVKDEGCISITPIRVRFPHDRKALKTLVAAVRTIDQGSALH